MVKFSLYPSPPIRPVFTPCRVHCLQITEIGSILQFCIPLTYNHTHSFTHSSHTHSSLITHSFLSFSHSSHTQSLITHSFTDTSHTHSLTHHTSHTHSLIHHTLTHSLITHSPHTHHTLTTHSSHTHSLTH